MAPTHAAKPKLPGGPSLLLTGVRPTAVNSWVWGVALNWQDATVGTAGTNQTVVDSVNDTASGDAQWVQRQNATTPASGTVVTINDTAPSVPHLLAVVEILAAN